MERETSTPVDAEPARAHPLRWAVDGPPIGTWWTVRGSADILMSGCLVLFEDGTGLSIHRGVMSGEERVPLTWRHVGPGRLVMKERAEEKRRWGGIVPSPELEDELEDEGDEKTDNDPEHGYPMSYETGWTRVDAGGASVPILRSAGADSFGLFIAPIGYEGPPEVPPTPDEVAREAPVPVGERRGTGALSVAKSVGAAMIGVQSRKNRERDFTEGKPLHFVIGGVVGTLVFLLAIWLLVQYLIATS